MKNEKYAAIPLPVTRPLSSAYIGSLFVALLIVAASLAGLLFTTALYPTEELQQSFVANDVVNLAIGLPILLGSMWITRHGKLLGLLLWPGALLYGFYNYLASSFGIPFGWLTIVHLAIVLASAYIVLDLLRSIDQESIKTRLDGFAPAKSAGSLMVLFGVLFILRVLGIITEAQASQTTLLISEIGLAIADVVLSVLWIAGGVLLLRRKPLGFVSGLGLLFAASMLFIGLLALFILQPFVAAVPFPVEDFIVISVMGLICFIPFGSFVRAVLSTERS